jgi:hypothetical protein
MNTNGFRLAVSATLHCLTGCAIGEVLGTALGSWLQWPPLITVMVAFGLAFVSGYSLALVPLVRSGMRLGRALGLAVASDTVSIFTMEVVDNAVMLVVPGALTAGLATGLFWLSLAGSLAVAFVVTVPVNHFLIRRGQGHALMHEHHH